jgi:AraC-like DNA-binding protein
MHADAAHLWTVPELAAASGLSRAAFARSFQQALDQPPMQYLTDWRMTIAARTGYASPYAFAAAFRRHHGQPPVSGANESWTDPTAIRQRPLTMSTPDDG